MRSPLALRHLKANVARALVPDAGLPDLEGQEQRGDRLDCPVDVGRAKKGRGGAECFSIVVENSLVVWKSSYILREKREKVVERGGTKKKASFVVATGTPFTPLWSNERACQSCHCHQRSCLALAVLSCVVSKIKLCITKKELGNYIIDAH